MDVVRKFELLKRVVGHRTSFRLVLPHFMILAERHCGKPRRTNMAVSTSSRGAGESHPLALSVQRRYRQKLHAAHQRMVLLSRKTSTERLASFVLEMDKNRPKRRVVTQLAGWAVGCIADYLGLTTETVCLVPDEMTREGTVRLARTRMEICDRPKLHTQAGVREAEGNKLTAPQVWRHPVDEPL